MSEAAVTSPIRLSQELTIFHDVAKALTSSLNLDSILQTIMEKMAEYFRPDTWSLLMLDHEREELYFAIAVGTASEMVAPTGGEPMIQVRGLTKVYHVGEVDVHALRGVDLDVARGEFVAIVGASGSGKSTLFHILGGLTPPTSGTVCK